MSLTQQNLEVASKQSAEAVKVALENGAKSPEDRVQNAKAALDMLKEMNALSADEKKRVVEASRIIIQSALETTTTELQSTATEKLQSLQESQQINLQAQERFLQTQLSKITAAKEQVLALQRELESSLVETGVNAGREVMNDLKTLNTTKAITYGVAAVGGAYVTNSIFQGIANSGIGRFFLGTAEKPTLLRRLFKTLGIAVGAVAGAVGLRAISDRMPSFPTLPTIPTGSDIANTATDSLKSLWNSTVGAIAPDQKFDMTEKGDGAPADSNETANLTPQQKLESLLKKGKYSEALVHSIRNGGGLEINEEGKAFLNVEGGEPIEVTPEALQKIKEFSDDPIEAAGEMSWVSIWTTSGALYLISRATLGKILYGKDLMPKTWKGKAFSVAKAALGPLPAIRDAAGHAGYAFRPRGGEQWWARFASQSVPARSVRNFQNWSARQWFQSDISNEKGLLKTIKRRMFMKNIVELLELSSDKGPDGKPLPGSDLEKASAELKYLDGRVKAGLTVMEGKLNKGKKIESEALREMTLVREKHADYDQNMQDFFGHKPDDESVDEDLGSETEAEANQKMRADAEQQVEVEAKTEAARQQAETKTSQELSATQRRVTELENDLSHQLQETSDLRAEQANAVAEVADMKQKISEKETRVRELEKNASEHSEEITRLKKESAEDKQRMEQLESESAKTADKLTMLEAELKATQLKLEQERAASAKELEAAKAKQTELQTEVEQLKFDVAAGTLLSEMNASDQEAARERMQANIDEKSALLKEAQAKYEKLVQDAEASARAHAEEVAALKKKVDEESKKPNLALEEELRIARLQAASLREKLEAATDENKKLKDAFINDRPTDTAPGKKGEGESGAEATMKPTAKGPDRSSAAATPPKPELSVGEERPTLPEKSAEPRPSSGPTDGETGTRIEAKPTTIDPGESAAATSPRNNDVRSNPRDRQVKSLDPNEGRDPAKGDDPSGKGAAEKPANPLKPNGEAKSIPRDRGSNDTQPSKGPDPKKPLPGQQAADTKSKDGPASRPARKGVVTDPRLSGSVKQDSRLGNVDLKKGNPDGRGSKTDTDTKLKVGR